MAEHFQLVGQADIGQVKGLPDLLEYTSPVCPGHYNHMYLHSNPRIGQGEPRRR